MSSEAGFDLPPQALNSAGMDRVVMVGLTSSEGGCLRVRQGAGEAMDVSVFKRAVMVELSGDLGLLQLRFPQPPHARCASWCFSGMVSGNQRMSWKRLGAVGFIRGRRHNM